jgi:hypothetical protein
MTTKKFESLMDLVNPSLQGCPYPLVLQNIKDSAIRTCERTLYWRHVQPVFALTAGIYEYKYRKPVSSDVHAVFSAVVNNTAPLRMLTLEDAIAEYPQWADVYGGVDMAQLWSEGGSLNTSEYNGQEFNYPAVFTAPEESYQNASDPRVITQVTPDKFVVLPLPDDAKAYNIRMIYALKPKKDATFMPAVILDELTDVIVHGALQELLVMPNHPWTDRELASYHAKQYLAKLTERRARANLGNGRTSLSVRMRSFA